MYNIQADCPKCGKLNEWVEENEYLFDGLECLRQCIHCQSNVILSIKIHPVLKREDVIQYPRIVSKAIAKREGYDLDILEDKNLFDLINSKTYQSFVSDEIRYRVVKRKRKKSDVYVLTRRKKDCMKDFRHFITDRDANTTQWQRR